MAKKPSTTLEASADAAAAFADGHIDPIGPHAPFGAVVADPLAAAREESRVALMEDPLDPGADVLPEAPTGYLLVTCATPGFRRAGLAHPVRADYPRDAFTQEQIDALLSEPRITMVPMGGDPIPRETRLFGDAVLPVAHRDPLLAGRAAAAAISDPPNRAAPGLRNAVAGDTVAGFGARY